MIGPSAPKADTFLYINTQIKTYNLKTHVLTSLGT